MYSNSHSLTPLYTHTPAYIHVLVGCWIVTSTFYLHIFFHALVVPFTAAPRSHSMPPTTSPPTFCMVPLAPNPCLPIPSPFSPPTSYAYVPLFQPGSCLTCLPCGYTTLICLAHTYYATLPHRLRCMATTCLSILHSSPF